MFYDLVNIVRNSWIVVLLAMIIANIIIICWHQKPSSFLSQISSSGRENIYVELRRWKALWGLTFDSQKEINLLLQDWNEEKYICTHYQFGLIPNINILRWIWIIIVFFLTLGSVQYWVGPTFLFKRKAEQDKIENNLPVRIPGNVSVKQKKADPSLRANNSINVRKTPDLLSEYTFKIKYNEIVTLIEIGEKLSENNYWYHIKTIEGNDGWAYSEYFEKT